MIFAYNKPISAKHKLKVNSRMAAIVLLCNLVYVKSMSTFASAIIQDCLELYKSKANGGGNFVLL